MLTCMDVKFIFDSVRLGLSNSANILQIADVALRVVFLLFLLWSLKSKFSLFSLSTNWWLDALQRIELNYPRKCFSTKEIETRFKI